MQDTTTAAGTLGQALMSILIAAVVTILTPSTRAQAQAFTIDTSAASPLTGLWWNATESGWGATITQQSHMMFVTMFVYDATGKPVWYTLSCVIAGASCSGELMKVTGGATPTTAWSAGAATATKVGTMALVFTGNDTGSMSYTLDGQGGARQIARQIFGPPAATAPSLAGAWLGAIIEIRKNCSQAQNNGSRATYGQYDIGLGAGATGALAIGFAGVTGLQCNYNGTFTTNGARMLASGALSCNDGKRGTWHSTGMTVSARSMSLELAVQLETTETCVIDAVLGGSRP